MNEEIEERVLMTVAELMCLAARTAPKAKGVDNVATTILEGEEKQQIADQMRQTGEEKELPFFIRDAENVESSPVLVIIGTRLGPVGIPNCGLCGVENCDENAKGTNVCVFNSCDLGIALGSAASVAAQHRADNRIMFTAGKAAVALRVLGEQVKIAFGIPLSATGKSPFFDRE